MKGLGYFKRIYGSIVDGIGIARGAVTNRYNTLADLIRGVNSPISEQMEVLKSICIT